MVCCSSRPDLPQCPAPLGGVNLARCDPEKKYVAMPQLSPFSSFHANPAQIEAFLVAPAAFGLDSQALFVHDAVGNGTVAD